MQRVGFKKWLILPIAAAAITLVLAGCTTMAGSVGPANGAANQDQMQRPAMGHGM